MGRTTLAYTTAVILAVLCPLSALAALLAWNQWIDVDRRWHALASVPWDDHARWQHELDAIRVAVSIATRIAPFMTGAMAFASVAIWSLLSQLTSRKKQS